MTIDCRTHTPALYPDEADVNGSTPDEREEGRHVYALHPLDDHAEMPLAACVSILRLDLNAMVSVDKTGKPEHCLNTPCA